MLYEDNPGQVWPVNPTPGGHSLQDMWTNLRSALCHYLGYSPDDDEYEARRNEARNMLTGFSIAAEETFGRFWGTTCTC